ncbi:MAG: hypothetical protein UY98_C0020G0007 [Candidatus Kaiserbacteria bacterium GW2011_GWA2_58_9]|uniref:Capsule polysaccharide biosynthesis protein n=1 Tax=Candidatus Kaiserbacteria bacterium GW2011_GWA2_58_9 TaxID=1618672 RepID=A0A0G2AZW7_9BACT|nr:MAG: hypothetical protein UY98_C0020G0007 [Candidatus Kaiserbacteria bacterium GW2011_GWA2_58_9]
MGLKGCLVLQRRFAYVGHELAILLKEKHGVEEFCAFVSLRESYDFLKSQNDIRYSGSLLDEDVQKKYKDEPLDMRYIGRFEAAYGSAWDFIKVDRIVHLGQLVREYPHARSPYTKEEMLRMVQVYGKSVEAFLEREKPDFVLTYQPGALWMLMMYRIAKKKGIPVLTIVLPTTRNRVLFSQEYDSLTWVDESFKRYLGKPLRDVPGLAEAQRFIEEFRARPVMYSEVYSELIQHGAWKQFRFLLPGRIGGSLRSLFFLFYNWCTDPNKRSDYNALNPFLYLYDRTKRKLRALRGAGDLYDAYDAGKPYAFYALHFEPELSVLLLSPNNTDQISIVRMLARALPPGMLLYVKEHPQMTAYRPRSYYKELKKTPNVRLLRPELSSFDIMRGAALVSTITGAAGWEAALLGRPVLTFGDVFYNALPSVGHYAGERELPALVERLLKTPVPLEESERYLAALLEDSAECDILSVWEKEEDGAKKRAELAGVAELLAKKIRIVTASRKN